MKTYVYCTLQIEGTHSWPSCPLDEVDYLRAPHRHIFYIKAYAKVFHDDRDIEFIVFKHQIQSWFRENYWDESKRLHVFGHKSCEMIGKELINTFTVLSHVDVSEDNENGAVVYASQ